MFRHGRSRSPGVRRHWQRIKPVTLYEFSVREYFKYGPGTGVKWLGTSALAQSGTGLPNWNIEAPALVDADSDLGRIQAEISYCTLAPLITGMTMM
eukprot:3400486-Rhodomonas_salina.2